jgi:hypothetical protein
MGWTTPTDRTTGYTVTAADWNIVEDNLSFLYGDTGWTNVGSFTNSWANAGTGFNAAYRMEGTRVKLRGVIHSGTIGSAAFTLPAGYRPAQNCFFATSSNSLFGQCNITTAGVVTPAVGSNVSFVIDNISFDVLS